MGDSTALREEVVAEEPLPPGRGGFRDRLVRMASAIACLTFVLLFGCVVWTMLLRILGRLPLFEMAP